MNFLDTLLITLVIFTILMAGYVLMVGPNPAKAQKRRLEALRYRHADSADAKVEAQFKRALASRRPMRHRVAGSGSRLEALALRLDRTGKNWALSQYLLPRSGLALLSQCWCSCKAAQSCWPLVLA